jgi:SAM-dependent methyltransferase
MSNRTVQSHGQFFLSHLTPGVSVLDCGCGPGSITLGIAAVVAPGRVVGIDVGATQIARARWAGASVGVSNATFEMADCYSLPFPDSSFDRVFSHALMEHLSDPRGAMKEIYRVLKRGGVFGVCSPDWGGFVLAPPSAALGEAVQAYTTLQSRNGGDVRVGRKLGVYLKECGFTRIEMSARYECYSSLPLIGEYLALQLERQNDLRSAAILRDWSQVEGGMFAQCWVSCIGYKES